MKIPGRSQLVHFLLRVSLAFVFGYAALSSLLHPLAWIGFMPTFLTHILAAETLVKIFAVYEVLLVGWLLIGRYTRYAAVLCMLTLGGIVIMNPHALLITFRDIGLAIAALALFFAEP